MIQILIIMFIIIFIEILIIGLIFSKISIQINKFDVSYDEIDSKKFKINEFEILVKFYLFKYIKILSVKLYKDYLKIFNIKIKFDLLRKFKIVEENYKKIYIDFTLLIKNKDEIDFRLLKPQIYSFNFEFEIGTFSQMFTTFMIPTISTSIAIILNNLVQKINPDDYSFKVIPKYFNRNIFKIKFNSKISFSTIKLMFFFFAINNIIKNSKTKNALVLVRNSKLKTLKNHVNNL